MSYTFDFIALNKNDMDIVLKYLKKYAMWEGGTGVYTSPSRLESLWIADRLASGEFYLVRQRGIDTAVFALHYSDELFWGKREDKAGYIHFFTADTTSSGQIEGYRILDDIAKMAEEKGCEYLRIECAAHMKALIKYYKNYGFKETGYSKAFGTESALMEKRIKRTDESEIGSDLSDVYPE